MKQLSLLLIAVMLSTPLAYGGCNPQYQKCTCDAWNYQTAQRVQAQDKVDHWNGGNHTFVADRVASCSYTQGAHYPGGYYCLPYIDVEFPLSPELVNGSWTLIDTSEYGSDFPTGQTHCDNWNSAGSQMGTNTPQSVWASATAATAVTQMPTSVPCEPNDVNIWFSGLTAHYNQRSRYPAIWTWNWTNPYPDSCGYETIPDGSTPLVVALDPSLQFKDAFTSSDEPVWFDTDNTGKKAPIGWTQPGALAAFLVLPNDDGTVTSFAKNMFGNLRPQNMTPALLNVGKMGGELRNGFNALAALTDIRYGGNGDATKLTPADKVFINLRLWVNRAHDGIYKPEEAYTLSQYGITEIDLTFPNDYHKSGLHDAFGNYALVEGKAKLANGSTLPIWDVVFQVNMQQ